MYHLSALVISYAMAREPDFLGYGHGPTEEYLCLLKLAERLANDDTEL